MLQDRRSWFVRYGGFILVALVLLGASFFLLYRLGNEPLQDYDEATYAEVAHEALLSNNFLFFTYGGESYFSKPPVAFWMMGVSESFLGETPFAMRLPFALSGILLIGVIMLLGYEVSGSLFIAAFAGAIAATTSPLMETAREVRTDVPVTFFIVAATYCFLKGLRDRRWFILFGILAGFAVLTKSVIAVFAFVAVVAILFFYSRSDVLKEKYFWYGIGAFLLVAVPWHILETVRYGLSFWKEYVGFQVIARTQANIFSTVAITNSELIQYLEEFFVPWLWMFFIAALFLPAHWSRMERSRRVFVLSSFVIVLIISAVFFLAATKAVTYFMPIYPFVALAIALSFPSFSSLRLKIIGVGVAIVLVLTGAVGAVFNAYHMNPYYSTYLALAVDEHAIGEAIAQTPVGGPWYVYSDQNLGSIMFYSQHLRPQVLSSNNIPAPGGLVVLDSNASASLSAQFPFLKTETVYKGSQVSLLKVN